MIRCILFWFLLGVFCLSGLILWPVGYLIGLFDKAKRDHFFYVHLRRVLLWGRALAGVTIDAKGLENIPTEPAVYMMNHRGVFDVVLLVPYINRAMGFVAKKELDHIPFFSWWMKVFHCVFLDRKDIRKGLQAIMKAADNVKNGITMVIFPEGTRSKDSEHPFALQEFRPGAMKLATKANVPIVPVAIYNTNAVFEDHKPYIRKTNVKIVFGEPIDVAAMPREEQRHLSEYVKDRIQGMLNEIEKEVG